LGTNDRISIDTSGNVGIGTTVPAAGARVHIAGGDLYMDGTTSVNFSGSALSNLLEINGVGILRQTTLNGGLSLGRDDSLILAGGEAYATLDSNVNTAAETVYIGAESGVKLYGFPNNLSPGYANRISAELNSGATSGGNFQFYTGSTELHRINLDSGGSSWFNNGGNFGIGTATPSATLHVLGGTTQLLLAENSSNLTRKISRFGAAHFTNAEEPVAGVVVDSNTAYTSLNIGGGTSAFNAATQVSIYTAATTTTTTGTERVTVTSAGDVGIGTTSPAYKLQVNGSFGATTKSFIIDHQSKPGKKLVYGVSEGPEHSVFVRGRLTNQNVIPLPEEWSWLVDEKSVTVQLTAIGSPQKLYVKSIDKSYIVVENGGMFAGEIDCYYFVQGTRKDVEPLQTVV
jgi:hypothetical protein